MAKSRNDIEVEDISKTSQYDGQQVLKDVHSLPGHYLRVRDALSVVPEHYTHFDATYNTDGQPTQVIYYAGVQSEISQVGTREALNLNNKYFLLYEGRSSRQYFIWFNVDGNGVEPSVDGTGIEIPLMSSDSAEMVAKAIQLVLNTYYNQIWKVTRSNTVLEIKALKLGETENTVDGNSTFIFSTLQEGLDVEVSRIDIDYLNNDPIYEGQVLRGHSFDIFSGQFKKNEVEVTLSLEQGEPLLQYNEINSLAVSATATVLTYTVPTNSLLKLKRANVSGCNMGTYSLKVNGATVDKLATYYTHFNGKFTIEDQEYTAGTVITIEVLNRGEQLGDFNANIQGRLINV